MNFHLNSNTVLKFLKRAILIISVFLLSLILIVSAALFFLPEIISSSKLQSFAKKSASKAMKRNVGWNNLSFGWRDGVKLDHLTFGSGAAPLANGDIPSIEIKPWLGKSEGRWRANLLCRIISPRIMLEPGPPKPLKPWKEPLSSIAENIQNFMKMKWDLPFDVGVIFSVESALINQHDPKTGKSFTLSPLNIYAAAPSLADESVILYSKASIENEKGAIKPITFLAEIRNLAGDDRVIKPSSAEIAVSSGLSGADIAVSGSMVKPEGLNTSVHIDISKLITTLKPFISKKLQSGKGDIVAAVNAKADRNGDLKGLATVELKSILISLTGMKREMKQPLHLKLSQGFGTNYKNESVTFPNGELNLNEVLKASWGMSVEKPARKNRVVNAHLISFQSDLGEALKVAAPFLPPKTPLTALSGSAGVKNFSIRLDGAEGEGSLKLEELLFDLKRVSLKLKNGSIDVDRPLFKLSNSNCSLIKMKPVDFSSNLIASFDRLKMEGNKPVDVEAVKSELNLSLKNIVTGETGVATATFNALLTHSLSIGKISDRSSFSGSGISESLSSMIKLNRDGSIHLSSTKFDTVAKELSLKLKDGKSSRFPFSTSFSTKTIAIEKRNKIPLVENAEFDASIGKGINATVKVNITGEKRSASSNGTISIDLKHSISSFKDFIPKGIEGIGNSTVSFDVSTPSLPLNISKDSGVKKIESILSLFDRSRLSLAANISGLRVPSAAGETVLEKVQTLSPISIVSEKGDKIALSGEIVLKGLATVKGGKTSKGNDAVLKLSSDLLNLDRLLLNLSASSSTLGVRSGVSVTAGRIKKLLESGNRITAASLLNGIDFAANLDIFADMPKNAPLLPNGTALSGSLALSAQTALSGGKELSIDLSAKPRHLYLNMPEKLQIEDLHGEIAFNRRYRFSREESSSWKPLSSSLIAPDPEKRLSLLSSDILSRITEESRGAEKSTRRIKAKSITFTGGKSPLNIRSLEGDMTFASQRAGLSFLQCELLGGTVRMTGMFDLSEQLPVFTSTLSFSGLETALLTSSKGKSLSVSESALTGETSLMIALHRKSREFLEGIRFDLNVRSIGKDTIERVLYSIDPDEKNEKIVAQRKLLRNGTLKRLDVSALDGSLSVAGDVTVKGVDISLPRVERVKLSDMPIGNKMEPLMKSVSSLSKLLEFVRGDTLKISSDGKIKIVRENDAYKGN